MKETKVIAVGVDVSTYIDIKSGIVRIQVGKMEEIEPVNLNSFIKERQLTDQKHILPMVSCKPDEDNWDVHNGEYIETRKLRITHFNGVYKAPDGSFVVVLALES
jgi:hypothetical protein